MTDLLIATLLTGFAVTYLVELFDISPIGWMISKPTMNKYFALPLSFGGLFVFYEIDKLLIVAVPAATFISLMLGRYLNKPTVVAQQRLPRL